MCVQVYVSRLDAVKHMITSQLDDLRQQNPQACVGLVAFHDAVDVYGDGMWATGLSQCAVAVSANSIGSVYSM